MLKSTGVVAIGLLTWWGLLQLNAFLIQALHISPDGSDFDKILYWGSAVVLYIPAGFLTASLAKSARFLHALAVAAPLLGLAAIAASAPQTASFAKAPILAALGVLIGGKLKNPK